MKMLKWTLVTGVPWLCCLNAVGQDIAEPETAIVEVSAKLVERQKTLMAMSKYLMLGSICDEIARKELEMQGKLFEEADVEKRLLMLMPESVPASCPEQFRLFVNIHRMRLQKGHLWEQTPEGMEMLGKMDEAIDRLEKEYECPRLFLGLMLWGRIQTGKRENEKPEEVLKWLFRVRDILYSERFVLDKNFVENGIQ